MAECPNPPTMDNECGLAAAQFLARNKLLVIDSYGLRTSGAPMLTVDRMFADVQEMFKVRRVYQEPGWRDIADVGCVACEKCIRIIDDNGNLSASMVTEL